MFYTRTNMSAINTQRNLNIVTKKQDTALERLSSGCRINKAADDSAGISIRGKMLSQIRGLEKATRNVEDGYSLLSVVDGALEQVGNIVHRMRELTVQAANDTNNYFDGDRAKIQMEIDALTEEIDKIYRTTEFNTKKVFDGSCLTVNKQNELLAELHAEMMRMLGSNGSNITAESCVSTLAWLIVSGAQNSTPPPEGVLGSWLADVNYTWLTTVSGTYMRTNCYYTYAYDTCSCTYDVTTSLWGTITAPQYTVTPSWEYHCWSVPSTSVYGGGTSTALAGYPASTVTVGEYTTNSHTYERNCVSISAFTTETRNTTYGYTTPTGVTNCTSNWNPTTDRTLTCNIYNSTSSGRYVDGCYYFQPRINYTITTKIDGIIETEVCSAGQSWSNSITSSYLTMVRWSNVSTPEELHDYLNLIDKYIEELEHAEKYAIDADPPFPSITTMINSLKYNAKTAINIYLELELLEGESRTYQSIDNVVGNTGLWLQTGANTGDGFFADINIMNSETLGIGDGKGKSKITVDTPWYYEIAGHLKVIDYSIGRLNSERGLLGATQNRLDSIKVNLGIYNNSHQEAISRIQDANMAKEHLALTTANILQNSGLAMMAQANNLPQNVLQLLKS